MYFTSSLVAPTEELPQAQQDEIKEAVFWRMMSQ
jgi:hypothetical protein